MTYVFRRGTGWSKSEFVWFVKSLARLCSVQADFLKGKSGTLLKYRAVRWGWSRGVEPLSVNVGSRWM